MGPSGAMRPGGWFEPPSSSATGALGWDKMALDRRRLLVEGSGAFCFLFLGGMVRNGDFSGSFACPRFLCNVFVWLDQVGSLANLWVAYDPDNLIFDPVDITMRLTFPGRRTIRTRKYVSFLRYSNGSVLGKT
jgi:hypothetical protein